MANSPELHDEWELLHNSETGLSIDIHPYDPLDCSKDFVDIEGVSEVIIRSDYFTSDSMKQRYTSVDSFGGEDNKSVVSDNPSWVEPCSRYLNDPRNEFHSGEFWSDNSSCNEPIEGQNFDENHELSSGEYAQTELGFDGIGEIEEKLECLGEKEKESVLGVECSKVVEGNEDRGNETTETVENAETAEAKGDLGGEEMISVEGEKREMVWWKLPFEIVKFCLFKVSPGWSIAVAAAVMGIVIIRRRLHKMKRKSRMVPLTLTMEDKKVSQFMKNAARLNDAFSVVKRVPIIRPSLPTTTGVTPWPMISLR
ncbi:hypothetical protein ACHQM5_022630 [Ranunculus cassubicifolius]